MEFKGTKGAWKAVKMDIIKQDVYLIIDKGRYQVASADNRFIKDAETVKANAQLIANAPEMLDMLKKQYDFLVYCRDNLKVSRPVFNAKIMKIEQLIKEATTI